MSKNTSAANNWFVIHFWHWLGNQPLMNPVIPHLLESIKTEPHKNSGVVHVYCWGQWHITCLIIRGPASSLSCGYATDGTIYQVLRELPVTSGSAPGTGWITVGCTRNIWKNCWGNALPVRYLYYCVIFNDFDKFCFLLYFLSYWQPEVKIKKFHSLAWRIEVKQ